MSDLIYLDYMATTPLDPRVFEKMRPYLVDINFSGNPASTHSFGLSARRAVEAARHEVADLIAASPDEIVFTSGATEAINLAIKGAVQSHQRKGRHIITSKTEHKAVLDTCAYLEKQGFDVTYLTPDTSGLLSIEAIADAIREDTILISIMHANNEIGVIQDIQAIGELARERDILFMVDAAQSAGKIPIDVSTMPVDLMAFSGHKLYAPKGVGALYICSRPRVRIAAQMHGGGHERGLRSGTLATHQIVGLGEACRIAKADMLTDSQRILDLKMHCWDILSELPDVTLNGAKSPRLANNLNICVKGIDAEALLMGLPQIALSTASACNSIVMQASYVLKAIGLSDEKALSSLRISFGRPTTILQVETATQAMVNEIKRLRDLAPDE